MRFDTSSKPFCPVFVLCLSTPRNAVFLRLRLDTGHWDHRCVIRRPFLNSNARRPDTNRLSLDSATKEAIVRSFGGLVNYFHPRSVGFAWCECPNFPQSHFLSCYTIDEFDPYKGCRIGEANNPGPGNQNIPTTFATLNPTALAERRQDVIDLDAQCISLAETFATPAIQSEFSKFLKDTKYEVA